MTITLQANKLHARYNGHDVLHGVDLSLRPGEILGVIGPNGAGKTTLLRAMAGLLAPSGGAVLVEGRQISALDDRTRARALGLVPQLETQAWPVSVEYLVSLGRAAHRGWFLPLSMADKQIVNDVLARTGLTKFRTRPVTTLSGGERQRALIARALAQQPRVLLLDEPTAHLDLRYQAAILNVVRDLLHAQPELAVVLSLHDLNLAAIFADRLALLAEGQLVKSGSPSEVLDAALLSEVYGLDIIVDVHPMHGTPFVAPALVSKETPA